MENKFRILSAGFVCLCLGFTALSTRWDHIERCQFYLTILLLGRLSWGGGVGGGCGGGCKGKVH